MGAAQKNMSSGDRKCPKCGGALGTSSSCAQCGPESGAQGGEGDDFRVETLENILSKSNLKSPSGLAVLVNKDTNERYPLTQSVSKIGRDKANTISLHNDSYVSRHHAWVLFIKGSYWDKG
jgi:hypothetical protein